LVAVRVQVLGTERRGSHRKGSESGQRRDNKARQRPESSLPPASSLQETASPIWAEPGFGRWRWHGKEFI
jgi:hypothetical protein